jgi:hypothetical protein
VYLQSGAAVGAQGLRCDVQVQLAAALTRYRMPPPADHQARALNIRREFEK